MFALAGAAGVCNLSYDSSSASDHPMPRSRLSKRTGSHVVHHVRLRPDDWENSSNKAENLDADKRLALDRLIANKFVEQANGRSVT